MTLRKLVVKTSKVTSEVAVRGTATCTVLLVVAGFGNTTAAVVVEVQGPRSCHKAGTAGGIQLGSEVCGWITS